MFGQELDYGEDTHLNEAVMLLERGRASYARESALQQTPADMRELLYQHQAWMELRFKPEDKRTDEERAEFQLLDAVKDEIEEKIRSETLDANKSANLEIHELYAAIPESSIVIYTALSEDGLIVLCVDRTGVKVAFIDNDVNPTMVTEYMRILHATISEDDQAEEGDSKSFQFMVEALSQLLIPPPVERCIAARSHVIFIPADNLTRLPFGVLLFQGEHLQFQRDISQVPSLGMLHYLLNRTVSEDALAFRVVARPGHSRDPHGHLPMSGIEALCIASLFCDTPVDAKNVTRADLQQYLREANILHVSTHGFNDPAFPYNSCILLKEPFRVLDMLAVRSELALVTFSACLSNLGTASEAGDIQGFSHSILAAGANAFIGTLWNVNGVNSISEAWTTATELLYHGDTDFIVSILKSMMRIWDNLEANGRNPNGFVRNGRKKLGGVIKRYESGEVPPEWDFKHPKNWAAFILVGNGSTRWQRSDAKDLKRKLDILEHEKQRDASEAETNGPDSECARGVTGKA